MKSIKNITSLEKKLFFYMPDGTPISSAEEFISAYSGDYYLKDAGKGLVPGLSRCSKCIEDAIIHIRDDGIKKEEDVARILAWKIGKIKHRASQEAKCFQYSSDWQQADALKEVTLYNKEFDIRSIASFIVKNKDCLEKLACKQPQQFLNLLRDQAFDRIGTVYMITLLYFLSHGKYPIYDRFAMMALVAIEQKNVVPNIKEKVPVNYTALPDKNSNRFSTLMEQEMQDYINKLENLSQVIYGDREQYRKKREIDQALWVYGHLFGKSNLKC